MFEERCILSRTYVRLADTECEQFYTADLEGPKKVEPLQTVCRWSEYS